MTILAWITAIVYSIYLIFYDGKNEMNYSIEHARQQKQQLNRIHYKKAIMTLKCKLCKDVVALLYIDENDEKKSAFVTNEIHGLEYICEECICNNLIHNDKQFYNNNILSPLKEYNDVSYYIMYHKSYLSVFKFGV
jgi:hypothetical protein